MMRGTLAALVESAGVVARWDIVALDRHQMPGTSR
jgi:hypothetical protein